LTALLTHIVDHSESSHAKHTNHFVHIQFIVTAEEVLFGERECGHYLPHISSLIIIIITDENNGLALFRGLEI
jgi:hypothetical protein